MKKIVCNHIHKEYNNQTVLKDFNYAFEDTGFYCLYGFSGSGKTTLLNLIAKQIPIDSGEIYFNGKKIGTQSSAIDNEIFYMIQHCFFVDYLTIKEHIELVSVDKKKEKEYIKKYKLEHILEQYPNQISGGEKQRVYFVLGLLQNKKVFLLDEPTASLDPHIKKEVFQLLQEISKKVLVICVSHDADIFHYCDEVIDFNYLENYENRHYEYDMIANVENKTKRKGLYFYIRKDKVKRNYAFIICNMVFIFMLTLFLNTEIKIRDSLIKDDNINYVQALCSIDKLDECKEIINEYDSVVSYKHNLRTNSGIDTAVVETDSFESAIFGTLPFDQSLLSITPEFYLGSYFKEDNDIILGKAYAENLTSDIDSLIHKKLEINTPYGKEEFRVIGILNELDYKQNKYLDNGIGIENNDDNVFFNSKYTEKYEKYSKEHGDLGLEGRIAYTVFFNDIDTMIDFYDKYQKNDSNDVISLSDLTMKYGLVIESCQGYAKVLIPLAYILSMFSCLLYMLLQWSRLNLSSHIFSVYVNLGYSFNKIKMLYFCKYVLIWLKNMVISMILACIAMYLMNYINRYLHIMSFTPFYIDYKTILLWFVIMMPINCFITYTMMNMLKLNKWYKLYYERKELI